MPHHVFDSVESVHAAFLGGYVFDSKTSGAGDLVPYEGVQLRDGNYEWAHTWAVA